MNRIAKTGFWLLLDRGDRFRYEKGDVIAEQHAGHWYAIDNSDQVGAGEPAPAAPKPAPAAPQPAPAPVTPAPEPAKEPAATEDDEKEDDEKEALVVKAKALGIKVDARWGVSRLRQEILEAETD